MSSKKLLRRSLDASVFEASVPGQDLQYLGFKLLRLGYGDQFCLMSSEFEESVCILVSGEIEIQTNLESRRVAREGLFTDLPSGVFVSGKHLVRLLGIGKNSIVAVATVDLSLLFKNSKETSSINNDANSLWIEKSSILEFERGTSSYHRFIRNTLGSNFPSRSILCGETINPSGNWSSFPPHKHDKESEEESCHEELYLYFFDPPQGWGYQEVYSQENNLDEVYRVENGDVVLLPYGYHPVVSAPGYQLCYLWFLAGLDHDLRVKEDPNHAWISEAG